MMPSKMVVETLIDYADDKYLADHKMKWFEVSDTLNIFKVFVGPIVLIFFEIKTL